MYIDTQSEFSDAQAVTSTAISTNVIDLQSESQANTLQNIGAGEDVYLVVQTQTTATDTSSDATLTVSLESDSTADLATSATVHYSSGAIAFADFATAGTRLVAVKLPEHASYERYLGVRYTVADGPLTAGAFDAFITKDVPNEAYYASGFAV